MFYYFLKLFPVLLILLIVSECCFAQKTSQVSMGATFFYSRDQIISESIYSGRTTSFFFQEYFNDTKALKINYLYGDLYSKKNNKWRVFSPSFSFILLSQKIFLKNISNQFGISVNSEGLWIESSFNSDGSKRNGRKSGFLLFYPSLEYQAKTTLFYDIDALFSLSVPLLFYTLRPGYSTLDPDRTLGVGSSAFNVAGSGEFQSLLEQPKFLTSFSVFKSISNNLQLVLSYDYHLQKIDFPKEYSSVDQSIKIGVRWKK